MKLLRILLAAVVSAALLLAAPLASAGQAPPIGPHRHFHVTPDGGLVPVGPQICENPNLQTAFNEFHAHIHVGPANTAFDHDHGRCDTFGAIVVPRAHDDARGTP